MADLEFKTGGIEPLKANRWIVKMFGTTQKIPEYTFKNWNLKTENIPESKNKGLKLTLSQYNVIHFLMTPEDAIGCKKIKIEFLDPTGQLINYYDMVVVNESFEIKGDYSDGSLLTNEMSFWVKDIKSMIDDKTLENYKKRKEEESTSNK